MSRTLTSLFVFSAWSVLAGFEASALAQTPPQTPPARQPRPQGGAGLQVQNLPAALEQLLKNWSQRSALIQTLRGTHRRFVYDRVFMTEKRSVGAFYYEAPSKGRIDIQPAKITPGEKVQHQDGKTGKILTYALKQESPERWICNGQQIWQVNDTAKQVEVVPIPPDHQGQNIMDGPLPFLFGMPPQKAKLRYQLAMVNDPNLQKNLVRLHVFPRLRQDAANWQSAEVILDTEQYLPRAVKLIDPTGNTETTYLFNDLKPNAEDGNGNWLIRVFGGGKKDPFRPDLKAEGYAFKVHNLDDQRQPPAAPALPSVVNLPWKDAKQRLEKLGCEVKIYTGKAAANPKLAYVVSHQIPAEKTPLQKGQQVVLTVYNVAQPAQPTPPGRVPVVLGLYWKEAGKKLEEAGYKVKYLPGQALPSEDLTYFVYEQTPQANQALQAGGEVTLKVYNKPK